ncbi:PEP-CTERM sorting domain-containing protein [Nostoc sp. CENA543]|uniref:NF038130 family PEP-CTERM protein n=1 Tax=Nostoc sp. CENA543 TaxID=1869241 RepID=UPI000CA18B88|nr:NF038130 family PEP-CTERM protein [Nostoc sp. CENA543]AUT03234.1 PEP-CTERM sorting domain-containing protein [Nostoc sp. CENA543]
MKKTIHAIVIGSAVAMGVSAIATSPAQAGSLTGVTIGGTAYTDYLVYDVKGTSTVSVDKKTANITKILEGNAANPTGNVELRASTEKSTFTANDFTQNTTLSGTIGGEAITLSSLTASDWTSLYKDTGKSFGEYWFNQALTANGFSSLVGTSIGTGFFNAFKNNGGFQRFSDPNISYVNQDDQTGLVSIGLAGHLNATPLLLPYFNLYVNSLPNSPTKTIAKNLQTQLENKKMQASEIVKYTYNGKTDYLFSFFATESGLKETTDGISHSGNYEVTFQGLVPIKTSQAVPEPSIVLGLLGVAGMFTVQRKSKKGI